MVKGVRPVLLIPSILVLGCRIKKQQGKSDNYLSKKERICNGQKRRALRPFDFHTSPFVKIGDSQDCDLREVQWCLRVEITAA